MLSQEYSTFARKLSGGIVDTLREHNDNLYTLKDPERLMQDLAAKGRDDLQPKDFDNREARQRLVQQDGVPQLLIRGTFAPWMANASEGIVVNCSVLDLLKGEAVGQVSSHIRVDADLLPYLSSLIPSQKTVDACPAWRTPEKVALYRERLLDDLHTQQQQPHLAMAGEGPLKIDILRSRQGQRDAIPVPLQTIPGDSGRERVGFGVTAGDTFSLHLRNVSKDDLAVVVLVDGRNVLGLKSPPRGGEPVERLVQELDDAWEWLFPGGSEQSIDGWLTRTHLDGGRQKFSSAPFTVARVSQASRRASYHDLPGEISIAIYGTKPKPTGARGDLAIVAGAAVVEREFDVNDQFVINHADFRGVVRIAYFDDLGGNASSSTEGSAAPAQAHR